MYRILSGKEPAEAVLNEAKAIIAKLGRSPKLVIVQVGEDPASNTYVASKLKKAETVGVKAELVKLPEGASEKELLGIVRRLNKDKSVDGFIVQTPLPKQINEKAILDAVDPSKDVDGWTSASAGRLFSGLDCFEPATPAGVMRMLDFYNAPIEGKNAVVVGRSNTVGKPMAMMLLARNATVTICHSRTRDLSKHTSGADILVAAVGKPGLITSEMVKEGAFIVDVGTTKVGDKIAGDVDFTNVIKKANCSPVPGGVGPLTVAMLISNVVKAASRPEKS
jgi:methylenetetrahydrofolate dehydrogenase (NADP+)/methenyltetrahydrofolate cyclohydrolase